MRIDVDDFKNLAKGAHLENFSEEALEEIFEYYEEFGDVLYDPVAFRCEWTEFTEDELIENYRYIVDEEEEEEEGEEYRDELLQRIVQGLKEKTFLRKLTDSFLVREF